MEYGTNLWISNYVFQVCVAILRHSQLDQIKGRLKLEREQVILSQLRERIQSEIKRDSFQIGLPQNPVLLAINQSRCQVGKWMGLS